NMRTGEILGAEALIRWQHPEAGLLQPVQFLPVIEGQPIAIDLGNWVIDEVLTQMERWRAEGLNLPVCVNITAQQLQQEDFMDSLRAHLAAHPECPASNLELELLESSALQDVPRVSEVIRMCSELGISFALDDLGTGYSTLTYLRNLPAQVLKVDQTFVRGMLEDPEDLTIVEGVLALVGAFRRQAVAEGVESAEHGVILLRLGCEMAQGYHIARPMPADQIAGWAAVWKPDPQWVEAGPVTEEDRPVLYAGVEHRAWFARVESILSGSHPMQTVAGEHQCRLGTWLREQHVAGGRIKASLARLEALHRKVHALGAELLAQRAAGDRTEAWKRLDKLRELMGPLQDKIRDLIRAIPRAR
ncbi:MAG TPA: EAL domain-containing protein, partial [Terriglobia bacterium]|nr:EAL domain-containing protein [Terriglobia bacterium]